ncbi:hydrolase [Rhodococcus hoagii]|nr:hydrolase [Prescottella equi]
MDQVGCPCPPQRDRVVAESVVQQNWADALGYDAVALWRAWAPDLVHRTTDAGHFMAEESPREIVAVLRDLLVR